jgi:hypothetical protein
MMVLWHSLAVLREMFSIALIMANVQVEAFTLTGPQSPGLDNKEALHRHVVDACEISATAPTTLDECGSPQLNVLKRVLNVMKDILSTYYEFTLSAITHKINVSGHILIRTLFLFCYVNGQNMDEPCSYNLHNFYYS